MEGDPRAQFVVVRSGRRVCALPVRDVVEIMRRLEVSPLAGLPEFIAGATVVRGEPTPVVNLDGLLGGGRGAEATRFVLLRCGDRHAVLAVDEVLGVRPLDAAATAHPLLAGAAADSVDALATRDDELVAVLRASRMVPDDAFGAAAGGGA